MTAPDPFAAAQPAPAPAPEPTYIPEEAQQQPVVESPWDTPPPEAARPAQAPVAQVVQAVDNEKVVLTFKAGTGFDQPWIVLRASSVDEAESLLDQKLANLMEKTKRVAAFFNGGGAPAQSGGGQQNRQAPPQGAQQHPQGRKEFCAHGEMKYLSGVSKKTGKPYSMFACNSGDRNNECKAVFA